MSRKREKIENLTTKGMKNYRLTDNSEKGRGDDFRRWGAVRGILIGGTTKARSVVRRKRLKGRVI